VTAPRVSAAVREFRAMNTDWWITVASGDEAAALDRAEAIVRTVEAAFSRFLPGSVLSQLNRQRMSTDDELARLLTRAEELRALTGGAFNVRVGPAMAAAGYDRSFELLDRTTVAGAASMTPPVALPVDLLSVDVAEDEVRLTGPGALDLGGIAKGWAIDQVAAVFESMGCRDYVVDGGGDIRAGGRVDGEPGWPIGIGNGLAVHVSGEAVCTSSTQRRCWPRAGGRAHHIIDPGRGMPAASRVTTATVIAGDATTADALATAIIVNPGRGLDAVAAVGGAALLERDGAWLMTPGMERWMA